MKAVTLSNLLHAFPDLTNRQTIQLYETIQGNVDPRTLKSVASWTSKCYNEPDEHEMIMLAVNEILDGYGTEAIFKDDGIGTPRMSYVNMGDTYSATILYDIEKERYGVGCWGDEIRNGDK